MEVTAIPFDITMDHCRTYESNRRSCNQIQEDRQPGHHVSSILKYIGDNNGYFKDADDDFDPEAIAIGLGIEEFWHTLFPDMQFHMGNIPLDDIWANFDGTELKRLKKKNYAFIHDCKATRKSSRKGADLMYEWWYLPAQIKAYLKVLDQWLTDCEIEHEPCLIGYGHVWHLNGDYNFGSKKRRFWIYKMEFEQKEIDSNWAMMLAAKKEIDSNAGRLSHK